MSWKETKNELPPANVLVDTKIDNERGIRNEQELKYRDNLWWLPDNSMYVYYAPTHWKIKNKVKG